MKVNRSLADPEMDRIDHALGRPLNPLQKNAREYYEATAGGPEAQAMADSPHWKSGGIRQDSHWFIVTDEGRQALAQYLIESGDAHRAYVVSYDAVETTVAAVSHSNARYRVWLNLRDVQPDLEYFAFAQAATVRLADG